MSKFLHCINVDAAVEPAQEEMLPPDAPPEAHAVNCVAVDKNISKLFCAQYARLGITCVECRKPRVIYSKKSLNERKKVELCLAYSEYDYTCGAPLLPPEHPMSQSIHMKPGLACLTPVELSYYSANIGRKDVCAHCGEEDGHISADLKKKYKTVLPICIDCEGAGKIAVVQRPYGNKGKKQG